MKYEQNPRPLIEEHYHIKELFEFHDRKTQDRQYHRDKEKLKQEREDLIKDAQPFILTEFWCDTCKEDLKAQAIKEVEVDWSNPNQRIAFYRTKCFKGHWCMRLVTDKHRDAYWFRSKAVQRDRGEHALDTLQPHETGFNMMYKKI